MKDLNGMQIKYRVIKEEDVQEYLHPIEQEELNMLTNVIACARTTDGKKENTYIVINTDEPYINEIVEILKKNGHWG